MSQIKRERLGVLCSIGAAIGFGCGATALKLIYASFGQMPFEDLSLLRSIACMAAFFALALGKDPAQMKTNGKELGFFIFTGVCGLFVVQFFLLASLRMAPVGVCSFVQASSTLMVCVLSACLFHERISRNKRIGIAVGLVGLACVVWQGAQLRPGGLLALGALCALASGVGKTVYLLCGKAAAGKGRRPAMMAYGMLACTLAGLPFASSTARIAGYFSDGRLCVCLLLYMLFCSVLPYLLTFKAVELLPASTAGALNVMEPVAGAASAYLALGEPLSGRQLLGAALIILSVLCIHRDAAKAAEEAPI